MPTTTSKVLFRGAATTTTTTTLYTVPSATTTVVTNIVVTNTGASAYTFTLYLAGTLFGNTVSIAANSIATFDIKQTLVATDTIQGGASNAAVTFHISGVEIV
jgi:hypothetical protein